MRRNGTGPQTPRGGGGSHNSDPASESSRTQAASSLSEVEHDEFLAQHEVVYGRTLTCQAPRALLWKALIRKIRHPELYTHAAGVKVRALTTNTAKRSDAGEDSAGCAVLRIVVPILIPLGP